jgi:hypothetical protein
VTSAAVAKHHKRGDHGEATTNFIAKTIDARFYIKTKRARVFLLRSNEFQVLMVVDVL